jgi:hypothetical protein
MKSFHEFLAMNISFDEKCFAITLSYSNFSDIDFKTSWNDLSFDYEMKKEVQNKHNMKNHYFCNSFIIKIVIIY